MNPGGVGRNNLVKGYPVPDGNNYFVSCFARVVKILSVSFVCHCKEKQHPIRDPQSSMLPVVRVVGVAGGEAEDVAVGGYAEAEYGAVGVGEVADDLVDLQDFAVAESSLA